jgi:hypothetical protein
MRRDCQDSEPILICDADEAGLFAQFTESQSSRSQRSFPLREDVETTSATSATLWTNDTKDCQDERPAVRVIFSLARTLKGDKTLAAAGGNELRPIVREWFDHSSPPQVTVMGFETTWVTFCDCWASVRFPAAANPVPGAFAEAKGIGPCEAALRYEDKTIQTLVTACKLLQDMHGDGKAFILSSRNAGEGLGVTWSWAAKLLRTLELDGLIKVVRRGIPGHGGEGSAGRYLYVGGGS